MKSAVHNFFMGLKGLWFLTILYLPTFFLSFLTERFISKISVTPLPVDWSTRYIVFPGLTVVALACLWMVWWLLQQVGKDVTHSLNKRKNK